MNFWASLVFMILSQFWISARPQVGDEKYHKLVDTVQGYVAEWECQETRAKSSENKPLPRANPATWFESGTWWLFGGQRPTEVNSSDFLGDLWSFVDNKWTILFQPVHDNSNTPMSSYPENLSEPTLCGNLSSGHLAVFGTSMTFDPELFEDNTVWLYDIPRTGVHTTDGVWTSYICCDECLPDTNTSLEFCPHFGQGPSDLRPLVWCSTDGLMALNHQNETVDWWKFDLEATEWVKLTSPSLQSPGVNLTTLFDPSCKTVGDSSTFSYVFCAVSPISRAIYVLTVDNTSVQYVSNIQLNKAFAEDPQLWSSASVLAATKVKGHTIIALAYQRLLDFWIHDHSTNRIFSLENLWQGESLREFQHSTGFYHVTLSFENETSEMYILNPRNNLTFDPSTGQETKFLVRIQSDTNVFLPDRDCLLDSTESGPIFEKSTKIPKSTGAKFKSEPITNDPKVQPTAAPLRQISVASVARVNSSLELGKSSTNPSITVTSQSNWSEEKRSRGSNLPGGSNLIVLLTEKKSLLLDNVTKSNETWTDSKDK